MKQVSIALFSSAYMDQQLYFSMHFKTLKLLNYIDTNKTFSELPIKALKNIKYSGITIAALFSAGIPYIYYAADKDDAPGVILVGMLFIFFSVVVATFAAVLQKLLQNAIDIKSENDLTV